MRRTWMNVWTRRMVGPVAVFLGALPAHAQVLLFADGGGDRVQQVPWPAGAPVTTLIPSLPSALDLPVMVKLGPDGMIYLTAQGSVRSVRRYFPDGTRDTSFVLPAGVTLQSPVGLAFEPSTGRLYVSDIGLGKVIGYDLDAGTIVAQISQGLSAPTGIDFDLAGNLYACDWSAHAVRKLPKNGTAFVNFVAPGSGTLNSPEDVLVVGGQLYVTSFGNGKVLRYSSASGSYLGIEAPTGSETLSNVLGLAQDPGGDIYVSCNASGKIERYKPSGAGHVGTFCTGTTPIGMCFQIEKPAPFPARAREVVATFCPDLVFPGVPNPAGACVKLVDARTGGPTGTNWLAPMFSNDVPNPLAPDAWTYANLGPVFATAIDNQPAPNIFVAATSAYGSFPFGPGGGGAVYKLEGCDGSIDPWIVTGPPAINDNKLPNASGVGLGDICFDRVHQQFFVSNLDDGIIYCFKDNGTKAKLIASFDPFGSNLVAGLPPLGDRIWGLHVYDDPYTQSGAFGKLLIFSVWMRDTAHTSTPWPAWLLPFLPPGPPPPANNALFSVQLSPTGAILPATLKLLRIMPYLSATKTYSNPVSDITSCTRYLLTAEKTMWGPGIPGVLGHSHEARTLRFQLSSGLPLIDVYRVGDIGGGGYVNGASSAGGVAVDQLLHVWSTGDAIQYPGYTLPATSDYVYGLQRFAWKGNSTLAANTWSSITKLIDLDHNVSLADKSQPGDVEVFPFTANMVNCPSSSSGGGGGAGHL